jgi:SAM-dependent methyltransferase
MKTRASGMPSERQWNAFFDPPRVLAKLSLTSRIRDVAEFGCGYGTFTVPAARIVRGAVYAFDIEPAMVQCVRRKARASRLTNLRAQVRDFVERGTGLDDGAVGYAMMFNILHAEEPLVLLREAFRVLHRRGRLAIMHWNYDPMTPRGPSMDIRPRPEQCGAWAQAVGFRPASPRRIDLPPYHYGMVMIRP